MKKSTLSVFAVMLVLVISVLGMGFAFDGDPAKSGMAGLLKGIGAGALAGLVAAFLGYLKSRDSAEKFDPQAAAATAIVGAVVGAFAGWQKKDLTTIEDWGNTLPLVIAAELVLKVIWRKGAAPAVAGIFATIKSGAERNPPK